MSDNKDISLRMRILSFFDGKGTADAAKDLEQLDETQSKANATAKDSKASSISASEGFATAGKAASAASSGGIGAMTSAMGGMLQKIKGVAAYAGTGGALLAAFSAWKAVIDAINESHDKLEKNLTNIQLGNTEAQISHLKDSYKLLTEELAAASAEAARFYNVQSAGADAIKRSELAKLELETAQAKAKLDPTDQIAARRLDLEIAQKKAVIEDSSAKRALVAEQKQIKQQTSITETEHSAAAEQQSFLYEQAAGLLAKQMAITARATEKADRKLTPAGRKEVWEQAGSDLERVASQLADVRSELQSAVKAQEQAAAKLANLTSASAINSINQSTQRITSDATNQTFNNTSGRITYDIQQQKQKEAQAAQEQQQAAAESRAAHTRKVLSAESNLRTARNPGGDRDAVPQLKAALDKAISDRATADRLLLDHARKTSEQANRTAEAVKNLPNN